MRMMLDQYYSIFPVSGKSVMGYFTAVSLACCQFIAGQTTVSWHAPIALEYSHFVAAAATEGLIAGIGTEVAKKLFMISGTVDDRVD